MDPKSETEKGLQNRKELRYDNFVEDDISRLSQMQRFLIPAV